MALVDLLSNSDFFDEFKDLSAKARKEEDALVEAKDKKRKKRRIKTIDTPVDNLLVSNPYFQKVDINNKKLYIQSENREREFIDMIYKTGKKTKVDVKVLDIFTIDKTEVDKFNQIAMLNSWISEFGIHQDFQELWKIHCYQDAYVDAVLEDHNNQYFAFSGTFTKEDKPKVMMQYFFAIDSKTGDVILSNFSSVKSFDYNAPIKAFLYDSFINLKRSY